MFTFTRRFNQTLLMLGEVLRIKHDEKAFDLKLRSGDVITAYVEAETSYNVLTNLDGLNTDRVPDRQEFQDDPILQKMAKYLHEGDSVYARGIFASNGDDTRFDVLNVLLLHFKPKKFLFENNTHWWLSQIRVMADDWLLDLFGDKYFYGVSDFAESYRTNLNIYGAKTEENEQDMQTLGRLIYGLSSAYLLLGDRRFLDAAAAGVEFQRTAFRTISHDGQTIIWSHSRKRMINGAQTFIPSNLPDDEGSIPLYEQIYALAGLTQYYRATGDGEVLDDIIRTVKAFNTFFLDTEESINDYPGYDGYFSHIDPVTMSATSPALGKNKLHKNWNSIGDHIPAYLVNLILALDPLPVGANKELADALAISRELLDRVTKLIIEKFPDPNPEIPYVNERFFADWRPDKQWGWQQNRAIVGHNLKIAWNLTRVANYYNSVGRREDAEKAVKFAERLAKSMINRGLDQVRGGVFDAVEREPSNGQPLQFVWGNTKDFWQQEQGILAYLILYGYTNDSQYLDHYRDICAWWNAFHLDLSNRNIIFRVNDIGMRVFDNHGKAAYDTAGYHSFELNYLAHVYLRTYVETPEDSDTSFCLYFRPVKDNEIKSINVLPDFLGQDALEIVGLTINNRDVDYVDSNNFQIPIRQEDLGSQVIVQYRSKRKSD
ncbi:MAG TPA: AGE family epimerase/isomerase [Bacillota bacterium]|nr:AGE family epimerase/isomerase [Bacillota bacterium]